MKSLNEFINIIESASDVNGFCILKPEFLDHTEDFLKMLSNNGWKVIQKQQKKIDLETAKELYKVHKDKDFYNDLCKYMASGDALYCMCHKDCEDPIKDMKAIKDIVRKNWGETEMKNGMHSSDSLNNVNRESKLIFEGKITENMNDPYYGDCCCKDKVCCGTPISMYDTPIAISTFALSGLKSFTRELFIQYREMLSEALSEEFMAWYQYTVVTPYITGEHADELKKLLEDTAEDELKDHAGWLMKKLNEIGFIPLHLFSGNFAEYICYKHKVDITSINVIDVLTAMIKSETASIETYAKLIDFAKDKDEDGCTKLKAIMKDEQDHLEKLQELLNKIIK